MKVTPEIIYNEYRSQVMFASKGIRPRPTKNFSKIQESSDWVWLEKCTLMVNNNNINYKLFITSLTEHYGGWFAIKQLICRKSLKIFSMYMKEHTVADNVADAKIGIAKSMTFIQSYCMENNISTWHEYMSLNTNIYPVILQHLSNGYITFDFLAIIPGFDYMLKFGFPTDSVVESCGDLRFKWRKIRMSLIMNPEIKKIANNFDFIVNKLIKHI